MKYKEEYLKLKSKLESIKTEEQVPLEDKLEDKLEVKQVIDAIRVFKMLYPEYEVNFRCALKETKS